MTERQMLVDQLIAHEGLRLKPYVDSVGKVTIGVGRNLTDCGISDAEAMVLLDHDLDAAVADCASFPWFAGLDGIRQRVIVDMRFNLGPIKFRQFKQTLAAVAAGDYVKASDGMLKSQWAGQVKTRATRLARMMATGIALLVLFAVPARAQQLPTPQARTVADFASWATVATNVAVETVHAWQAPGRKAALLKEGLRIGVVYGAVFAAKTLVHSDRPCAPACGIDNPHSSWFSGHTTLAFAALGGSHKTLAVSLAVSTGSLRVAAGKHRPIDVLTGAGVGLLAGLIR